MTATATADPAVGPRSTHLPVGTLHPSDLNLRKTMADDELERLVESVRSHGILQPLVVRPHPRRAAEWEIIAGHRRHRAAVEAGLATVPAIARNLTDQDRDEIMLIENLQRSDLDPVEEAAGYFRLVEHGHTVAELAERIGRSRSHVAGRLRLLELPDTAQEAVSAGDITLGEAQQLLELVTGDEFHAAADHYGGDLAADVTDNFLTGGMWQARKTIDKAVTDRANVDVRNRWKKLAADDTVATMDCTDDDGSSDAVPLTRIYGGAPDDHATMDCHVTVLLEDWHGALTIAPACTAGWGAHRDGDNDAALEARRRAIEQHRDTIEQAARQVITDTGTTDLTTLAVDIAAYWLDNRAHKILQVDSGDMAGYLAESHANRIRALAAACLSLAGDRWQVRNGAPEAAAAVEALTPHVPDGFDFTSDGSEETA